MHIYLHAGDREGKKGKRSSSEIGLEEKNK